MDIQQFIAILTYSLPMYAALVCFGVVFPWPGVNIPTADRKVQRLASVYFGTAVFSWFSVIIYPFFPVLFVYIQSFTYLGFLLVQVIFYHFVFDITKFDPAERFSPLHYLVPVLLFLTLFIWSFFVPFEAQLYIVESKAQFAPGYEAYSRLFTSKISGRFVFTLIYTIFALIRLVRYKRGVADFSANEVRSSLDWVNILIIFSFCFTLMPISSMIMGRAAMYASLTPIVTVLLVATQYIILTYNTIKGNFIVLDEKGSLKNGSEERNREEVAEAEFAPEYHTGAESRDELAITGNPTSGSHYNKEEFDILIKSRKPYLDADLKITDLAEMLGTNRAYLSAFINSTYGMNFSRYINTLRLQELEQVQSDPDKASLPLSKQIAKAGFGSYRNYKRFKENQ